MGPQQPQPKKVTGVPLLKVLPPVGGVKRVGYKEQGAGRMLQKLAPLTSLAGKEHELVADKRVD